MTDIHTHILPRLDDGPETTEEALQLLEMEAESGVTEVAFTPHFSGEEDSLEEFIERRDLAADALLSAAFERDIVIQTLVAAEVALSPKILELPDLAGLCYKNTGFMLVELPMSFFPDWIPQVLFELKLRGVTAVIAHVERYPYLYRDIGMLRKLTDAGSLSQVNAGSILSKSLRMRKTVRKLFDADLVQLIASDTHSVKYRPPLLAGAIKKIGGRFGKERADRLIENGESMIAGLLATAT